MAARKTSMEPGARMWRVLEDRPAVYVVPHGRTYDFSDLVPLYGRSFADRLAYAFGKGVWEYTPQSGRTFFYPAKRLLEVMAGIAEANQLGPCHRLVTQLSRGDAVTDPTLVQDAVEAVTSRVRNTADMSVTNTTSHRTRMNFIGGVNGALRRLNSGGLLPLIKPARYVRMSHKTLPKIPTLAELVPAGTAALPVEGGLSLDDYVAKVLALNIERLGALRACAERELAAEYQRFLLGRQWIASTSLPTGEQIQRVIDQARRSRHDVPQRRAVREALRAAYGENCEILPLAVRWVCQQKQGVFRVKQLSRAEQALIALAGGAMEVVRHLEATYLAMNAAFALLLIDTGLNVSVIENLRADPFIGTASRGEIRIGIIAAPKPRARGKTVSAVLQGPKEELSAPLPLKARGMKVSGLEAVKIFQEMSAPMRLPHRTLTHANALDFFWLLPKMPKSNAGAVGPNFASFSSVFWPEFMRRQVHDPVIGGLPISRRMVRTTVIQIRAAESGFHHSVVQAMADHANGATTMSYIDSTWIRAQMSSQIRRFQELMEAALVRNIAAAPSRLGMAKGELERRIAAGIESGFDFVCHETGAKSRKIAPVRPTCDPLDPCPSCPVRRLVPDAESLVTLHLAHKALQIAENGFAVANPRRWAVVWLRWRAMTEAYVSKLLSSPYRRRYEEAVRVAERLLADGRVSLPLVW